MPINGLSIMDGATSIAVTGGTAQVFTPDGVLVNNGIHVAAAGVADFRVRPHISFVNKNPQRKSNGSYTQGTRTQKSTEAYLDAITGIVHFCTTIIETRWSPVIPAATVKNARYKAAQLFFNPGLESFNANGDLS